MNQTNRRPQPQQIYRHFKGNIYQIQSIAYHSETGEEMVVYQALYGDYRFYVRPLAMFIEEVDHVKYPDVQQKYRFELVNVSQIDVATQKIDSTQLDVAAQVSDIAQVVDDQTSATSQIADVEQASATLGAVQGVVEVNEIEETVELAPEVIAFLDADNYSDRLEILTGLKYKITDDMIDIMSTVIDIEVKSGPVDQRYEDFKNALMTRKHYEGTRLR